MPQPAGLESSSPRFIDTMRTACAAGHSLHKCRSLHAAACARLMRRLSGEKTQHLLHTKTHPDHITSTASSDGRPLSPRSTNPLVTRQMRHRSRSNLLTQKKDARERRKTAQDPWASTEISLHRGRTCKFAQHKGNVCLQAKNKIVPISHAQPDSANALSDGMRKSKMKLLTLERRCEKCHRRHQTKSTQRNSGRARKMFKCVHARKM